MSKPKAPPAPNYIGAAEAQGQANIDAARTSAKLSNPNISNVYGTQTVKYGSGGQFDQAAYDKALADFNAGGGRNAQSFDAEAYLKANPDVAANSVYGNKASAYKHYLDYGQKEGRDAPYKAPSKDQFMGADYDPDAVTVTQTLSPEQQKLFDQDMRISQGLGNLAEGGIDRVGKILGTGFDSSNLPGMAGGVGTYNVNSRADQIQTDIAAPSRGVQYDIGNPTTGIQGAVDSRFDQSGDQVQEALYRQQTRMLDPQYQQQASDLESRLANQGIMPGSEAYNREMGNFTRQRDSAYADARDRAILAGGNEQSRLFNLGLSSADLANRANEQEFGQNSTRAGFANSANQQEFGQNLDRGNFNNQAVGQQFNQDLSAANQNFNQGLASAQFGNQARQQALQEQLALRQLPLNEINALRSGAQVNVPQFQAYTGQNVAAAPIMSGTQAQDQANIARYNAEAAQSGNMMGGLFNLGASYLLGGRK